MGRYAFVCRGGSGAAPARVAEDPPVYVFEDYLSAAEVRRGLADGVGGVTHKYSYTC